MSPDVSDVVRTKWLVAHRTEGDERIGAAQRAPLGRLVVDLAEPGQSLLAKAGMRTDGVPRFGALSWQWRDPGPVVPGADLVFALEEHTRWEPDPERPAGSTGRVKQVSFVRRRPDIAVEEFRRHYLAHAAVAREHHAGIHAYTQNLVTAEHGAEPTGADGISELWFASAADYLERFYTTPESVAVVRADNEEYIDFRTTFSVIVFEHVIRSGEA